MESLAGFFNTLVEFAVRIVTLVIQMFIYILSFLLDLIRSLAG